MPLRRSLGRCAAAALLALAALAGTLPAQEKSPARALPPLTPEAALNLRTLSDLQFSPDGARLAVVVTEPPKGEGRAHHIWVLDKATSALRQFTFSAKSETSPRWSPDGSALAFLSNREEFAQIYLLRAGGGEAAPLTKGKRNITSFAWSPDGKQLAFLAPDAKSDAEEKREKDKDDARAVDKDDKRARLWLLNVASGETRALTAANWQVSEVVWHPAGDALLIAATDHPESDQETQRILAVSATDGTMKQIAAPRGPFGNLRVSPNGGILGYIGCREDGPAPHDLLLQPLAGGAARNLTGASLDRAVFDYRWRPDGGILAVAADGFRTIFAAVTPQGLRQELPALISANPGSFALAPNGEIAFVSQTASEPQELWLWDQKLALRKVSQFNDAWRQYALAKPDYYQYKSFDGLAIEAALLKPAGYDGKSKLPLIALIHGGPTGNWQDAIETWGQLLAARGYAVFYPNIRGSIGYGQKFVESNRADWGGADFKDVMAGVDDLVARGIADPDKLGIGGWSYGGYMAEWAITQTTRFKAAVSGAGMANLISEYGTEEHPSYDEWFWSVPYEKPEGFLNSSPFLYLKNAKTPTLILQGEADSIDPLGQSQELYRGLKRYGVETELVVYPRENHGFAEEKHVLDRLKRILAWYDKHLK
ncbi:MAG: S9 family peptidase [Acidobacteriia bacterium]|nr:S9 family peptidase [Terriglobia bacterium]